MRTLAALGVAVFLLPTVSGAHPVPRQYYDRTITVHLSPERVAVDYQLDADVLTIYDDLAEFSKEVDLPGLTKPEQFCTAFNRCYGPILADNLTAQLDGKDLAFRCARTDYATRDETGQPLDHIRCLFRFTAPWTGDAAAQHEFRFREGNYVLQTGRVRLSLTGDPPVRVLRKSEPDEALKARPDAELRPGDQEALRRASATFVIRAPGRNAEPSPAPEPPAAPAPASGPELTVPAVVAVVCLAGLLFLGRQLRRLVRT